MYTGLSQANAEKRVDDVIAKEKTDADAARKAGAHLSIFTGVSMLMGAFIAAAAASLGVVAGTRTGELIQMYCGWEATYREGLSLVVLRKLASGARLT